MQKFIAICFFSFFLFTSCFNSNYSKKEIVITTTLKDKPVLVGNIPIDFPLVKDDVSLNILAAGHSTIDFNDVFVWQKYSEMTGVKVNWSTVSRAERSKAVSNALMNKQNFDLILRCKISATNLVEYGERGLILDLAKDDFLKNNAPNCWAYLTSHPEAMASITNPDGSIYSLPQINSGAELRVSRKIFINKIWLKNVNMDVPTTTQEYYQVLKAFKEKDANGNGIADEIPLSSQDWLSLYEAFFGAFGLGNRGLHNFIVDYDEQLQKVRFISSSQNYKIFLQYFNKLYTEGLLDEYMSTMTQERWYTYAKNDLIGSFANTNLAGVPPETIDNWIAIDEPLEGPLGDKMWSAIRANFHSVGAAVIPATCKNPELALKWLDFFWTDEGTLFYHMGIENETFVIKEDGSYDYSPSIYQQIIDQNKPFDDVIALYSPYPGGGNPTVEIAPYFMGGEMDDVPAMAARGLFEYGPSEYWPNFTFSKEENAVLSTVQTDVTKYTNMMRVDFITGLQPFSAWDDYLKQLDKLNVNKVLEIYQSAVDRYNAYTADVYTHK